MEVIPPFPDHRNRDPKRMAELAVYRELEGHEAPGTAIYEAKINRKATEVDFAVWLVGVGRFAIQVKGGIYRVSGKSWYLHTPQGEIRKAPPLVQLWDSTMTLHDRLQEQIETERNPFFVPVLNLPDMEPDPAIEEWAEHTNVHVLFGTDDLVERLAELVPRTGRHYPPTLEETAEEVGIVMPGFREQPKPQTPQCLDDGEVVTQQAVLVIVIITGNDADDGQPDPRQDQDMITSTAGQVVILHADKVFFYGTGGETAG